MPPITMRQNLPGNIDRLIAQRRLYTCAKRITVFELLLAGSATIIGAVVVSLWTEAQPWVALAAILVPLVNTGWLDPWQDRVRRAAARIQEDFDCDVLDLPWNDTLAGSRPSSEDVHDAVGKVSVGARKLLMNWYPATVNLIPLHQARVICQRSNCRWDSRLRCRYRFGILVVLATVSTLVVLLGFANDMNMQQFVLAVAAPLSPSLLWGMREARRQRDAAATVERLKDLVDAFWREVSGGELTEPAATRRSRELQDGILMHRRTNPPVFDWVYRWRRREHEEQMEISAEEMVAQVRRTS